MARNVDRTRRRFASSDWFCRHSRDERSAFECDAPLYEPSDDDDPPSLLSGKRPLYAPSGDTFSSSESDKAKSQVPHSGVRAQITWAAPAPLSLVPPDPMNRGDSSSTKSDSTKCPDDQIMEDAPPSQRRRTDSQMERNLD